MLGGDPVVPLYLVHDGEVELRARGQVGVRHAAGVPAGPRPGGVERRHHAQQPDGVPQRSDLGVSGRAMGALLRQPLDALDPELQVRQHRVGDPLPGRSDAPRALVAQPPAESLIFHEPTGVAGDDGDDGAGRCLVGRGVVVDVVVGGGGRDQGPGGSRPEGVHPGGVGVRAGGVGGAAGAAAAAAGAVEAPAVGAKGRGAEPRGLTGLRMEMCALLGEELTEGSSHGWAWIG